MPSRRQFLNVSLATTAAAAAGRLPTLAGDESPAVIANVPMRPLTAGPNFHWFGYYDKEQVSADGRLALSNEVTFEGRSPTADDTIDVGTVDLTAADPATTWTPIGQSSAWGWQQGCMLQWRPGHPSEVIWNDREGSGGDARFVARIHNVVTGQTRTIPHAIYALSPDGRFGVTTDFNRIQNMRPGYGYAGVLDPNEDRKAPSETGLRRVDLDTGESTLLVSYADMAALPHGGQSLADKWHYFNHLLVDPTGERMIFLHRWRNSPARRSDDPEFEPAAGGFSTRLVTCRCDDGSDRYLLDPSGSTSHFIWRDPEHICAWTRHRGDWGFWLFRDRTGEVLPVGAHVMDRNGHNTYVPGTEGTWILNDTYPFKTHRRQQVYLYHVPSNRKFILGEFHSPERYTGEVRCDTHPRNSRDGKTVIIDSPHGGGRQMYELEIGELIARQS